MKDLLFYFLLSTSCLAAVNVPLTIRETIYPGSAQGISRGNEPVTIGVPLPDSAGITSTSALGLTGASAGQFMVEGTWPSGNIKWVKVRAVVPSVSAGGTATLTLTDSGSGDFGGPSLAVDNGATITVTTGVATFTIRKANFNVIDVAQVGATRLIAPGQSQGLVLLGPDPTAAFPGNVTCLPTAGGSACSTIYSSSSDAGSTAVIEENGPAATVIKATGALTASGGARYMKYTVRLYFYKDKPHARITTILRNAEIGSTFATAAKGFQAFEIRLAANLTGTLTYNMALHSGVATNTLNQAGGSDYAYIYQAESNSMKATSWCGPGCVVPSPLNGYAVVRNGSGTHTGTTTQYPTGWATISDASGAGLQIGVNYFAGYGNKSLEFRNGGDDVRIGLWAGENNTTSLTTLTPDKPYYQAWPQSNTQDAWVSFFTSTPSSPANTHLAIQHHLAGAASPAHYNATGALPFPVLDPTEEDNYYASIFSTASPAVPKRTASDLSLGQMGVSDELCGTTVCAWRYHNWRASGAANQQEFRRGYLYRFIQRGFTGAYVNAMNWYRFAGDNAWPQSDGFDWRSRPSGEKDYWTFPTTSSANSGLAIRDWNEAAQEHSHMQGWPLMYFMSGDETLRDQLASYVDAYLNTASSNGSYTSINASFWNDRALGNGFKSLAALHDFLTTTGDAANAATIRANAQAVYNSRLAPDLCAYPGYPAGCTPDINWNIPQTGVSKVRGVTNVFKDSSVGVNNPECNGIIPPSRRTSATFMTGILLTGMYEWINQIGPSTPYYYDFKDRMYGITQYLLSEMRVDNGSTSWPGNGWRYKQAFDYPNQCNTLHATSGSGENEFIAKNIHPGLTYFIKHWYDGTTNWDPQFRHLIQNASASGAPDEMYYPITGMNIWAQLHPVTNPLVTVPFTVQANGGGSYTLTWTPPSGVVSHRVKYSTKQIVDWIGFNAATYTFIGNPATQENWFAAANAGNPTCAATCSLTVSTGVSGLTAANFMVKAYAGSLGGVTPPPPPPPSASDTTPPVVSITSPAAGATVSGTVTVSANATDNVGVTLVQFKLDGANLGSAISGGGPYSVSWNTTTAASGSHTLSAIAMDAAGNTGTSAGASVTVSNTAAGPVISNVTSSSITAVGAQISWTTNVPADSQVLYGTTSSYGLTVPPVSTAVTAHVMAVAGLTASTTYHFKVQSRDSQGVLSSSGDFVFTTAAVPSSGGGGTSIPLNNWTKLTPAGWPAEIMNYDKSEYIASRKMHCLWGAYKQNLSSEHNNGMVCYSYPENRWHVLEDNGYWHSSHAPGVGHSVSIWSYISDKDVIAYQADGSGSNSPESFAGFWWWYDVGGLNGQNRTFSPRPWLGVQTPWKEALTYDPVRKLLVFYDNDGKFEVCDPATNSCRYPTISGTPAPTNLTSPNLVYNAKDGKMYFYGGGQANIMTFECTSSACTTATMTTLSVTCSGAGCVNGKPPQRAAAGMAYSTTDNIMMMVGGIPSYNATTAYDDTWIFDPATLQWTEVLPSTKYFSSRNYFTADRLSYDPDSNVFVLVSISGYTPLIYAYAYSTASNFGRTSSTYTPPSGSLNRVPPTATTQSWSLDPTATASNGVVYLGWIESGANTDNTVCGQTHHPYIQSTTNNSTWVAYPGGSQSQACVAIDRDLSGSTNASKLRLAVINGTLWETHEKINHNQGYYSAAFAQQWTGSAWSGGAVGCFFAPCGDKLRQNPQALIGVGGAPTVAVIEWNHATYSPEGYLYVAQWNGTSWRALGAQLNTSGGGAQVLGAALATDNTNILACWSEQIGAGDRRTLRTTPQILCSQWNGSSWSRLGTSLNRSATSWANDPAVTYVGGKFYTSWTERTTGGPSVVYACRWDTSGCTLLGGGPISNYPTSGWAAHPSLSDDGTNVFLAWEEQSALGQPSTGYVKKWNGSSWSQLGGALNADATNGSVNGITLAVVNGAPTAIWTEMTFGNLRQTYAKQWNGTSWASLGGGSTAPPPPPVVVSQCDLNGDGTVNSLDVQSAIDQALGKTPCTNGDLVGAGQCNVVSVQRIITASLGGTCRVGP